LQEFRTAVKDEDSIALFKKMALESILCDMAQKDGFVSRVF
jgi:hypothetical protein